MIGHSYRRTPGGRRYSSADRAAAREAVLNNLPATLYAAARAAMMDRDGIEAVVDVAFEVESNRLRRPTTTRLLVGGVNQVPTVGTVASLSTGRSNPTHRFAVADSAFADEAVTFDPDLAAGDESAVLIPGSSTTATVPNGSAQLPVGGAGTRERWTAGVYLGASSPMTQVALPSALMAAPDDAGYGRAWVNDSGSAATLIAANRRYMAQGLSTPTRYRVGADGTVEITIVFSIAANARALPSGLFTLWHAATIGGAETSILSGSGFPTIVEGVPGLNVPRRIVSTATVTVPAGRYITRILPAVNLADGTLATRVELSNVQVYAGPPRSDPAGRSASAAVQDVKIEQTWATPRRVNRVDLTGELRTAQITAASVEVQTSSGGAWTLAGRAASSGRLAIPLASTYDAYGVRVTVEETTGGEGTPVWVTELDPSYVLDVSNDLASADWSWSRETNPGSSTSPVGNYEASSMTLELDNTSGTWNPAKNASLDVGHRVEAAIGVRYSNFSPNPVADRDLTLWGAGAGQQLARVTAETGLDQDAPADTAARVTTAAGIDPLIYAPPVYAAGGGWRRVGVWARYDGPAADGYLEASLVAWNGQPDGDLTTGVEITSPGSRPTYARSLGWVYVELAGVLPGGYTHLSVRVKGMTPAGGKPQTVTATRHYSGGHAGATAATAELVFEELLPAGVFYSEPFDTDSESQTVTIEAVDRLARLKDAEVAESVRLSQRLGTIVRDLALRVLDYDDDQVRIATSVDAVVIPYSYSSGALGSYLADLAKATTSTLYIDPLEVLTIDPRTYATPAIVEEIRADNSLISFKRPPGYDVTTSTVTVNASPLLPAGDEELWAMPSGGIRIPKNKSVTIVCAYSSKPAVNGYTTGMIADGTVNIASAVFNSDSATIVLSNPNLTQDRVVADLRVNGSPLVETPLSVTVAHQPSVDRYGPRNMAVDAKLVQTQGQLETVAQVLLDGFRALDDDGNRRLPDLSVAALGLLHVTPGDRVLVRHVEQGIGQEYAVLSRKLTYSDGALLLNDTQLREAVTGLFAIADQHLTDDGYAAGY